MDFRRLITHRLAQEFLPKPASVDVGGEQRAFGIDGKLLPVAFAFSHGIHKVVVNEQAAIDAPYRSHSRPGIYKSLCVGMLYTQGECDRATSR